MQSRISMVHMTHYDYHYYQGYSRLVLNDTYHHSFVRS